MERKREAEQGAYIPYGKRMNNSLKLHSAASLIGSHTRGESHFRTSMPEAHLSVFGEEGEIQFEVAGGRPKVVFTGEKKVCI